MKKTVRNPSKTRSFGQREDSSFTNSKLLSNAKIDLLPREAPFLEDRRLFNPQPESFLKKDSTPARWGFMPATRMIPLRAPSNILRKRTKISFRHPQTYTRLAFRDSKRVLVCVRRAVRRQILHALSKRLPGAGSGGKAKRFLRYLGNRPRHYTETSLIQCVRR
jgi:hypothetical protein